MFGNILDLITTKKGTKLLNHTVDEMQSDHNAITYGQKQSEATMAYEIYYTQKF